MWRPEDKASWLIHKFRKWLLNQLHTWHEKFLRVPLWWNCKH
jgi:hypothetical protein